MIPEFGTQKMVKREARSIPKKTARTLMTMAHYSFRQCVLSKTERDPSKLVRMIGEPGTSKTCGLCGAWNKTLGGGRVYKCRNPECSVELDRDVNGARNNLLALFRRGC